MARIFRRRSPSSRSRLSGISTTFGAAISACRAENYADLVILPINAGRDYLVAGDTHIAVEPVIASIDAVRRVRKAFIRDADANVIACAVAAEDRIRV